MEYIGNFWVSSFPWSILKKSNLFLEGVKFPEVGSILVLSSQLDTQNWNCPLIFVSPINWQETVLMVTHNYYAVSSLSSPHLSKLSNLFQEVCNCVHICLYLNEFTTCLELHSPANTFFNSQINLI